MYWCSMSLAKTIETTTRFVTLFVCAEEILLSVFHSSNIHLPI